MKVVSLAVLAAILTIGPAAASREDRDTRLLRKEIAGRSPGPPERCMSNARLGQATLYGDTIVYRDGATVWLNRLTDCPGVSRDPILVFDIFGGQLCENDIVRTVNRGAIGIPGPVCPLGKFTPYRKPR